jgi:hypothetical protein
MAAESGVQFTAPARMRRLRRLIQPLHRSAATASRPLRRRFDLLLMYRMDLSDPPPLYESRAPVEMAQATRAEVVEAARLAGPQFTEPFLARLDDGMTCFVAKIGGEVVAYNWTRFQPGWDRSAFLDLGPGEIYTTDAFTAEAWRGRRIHTETLSHMLRSASSNGYTTAYTMASVWKPGARKSMDRLGWKLSGRMLRMRLFGRRFLVTLWGSSHPVARRVTTAAPASAPFRRDSAGATRRTRSSTAP